MTDANASLVFRLFTLALTLQEYNATKGVTSIPLYAPYGKALHWTIGDEIAACAKAVEGIMVEK